MTAGKARATAPGPAGPGPAAPDPGPRVVTATGRPRAAVPSGAGAGLPHLADLIRDAADLFEQAIVTLGRNYDPRTAPPVDPWDPSETDIRLSLVVTYVRSALRELWLVPTMDRPEPAPGEAARPAPPAAVPAAVGESPDGKGDAVGAGVNSELHGGRS